MEFRLWGDCGLILRVQDGFASAEAGLDEVLGYLEFPAPRQFTW